MLVVVDRVTKFMFAYPLAPKEVMGVARKLFELPLMFGVPLSITTLCRWLRVPLDHGPADHPRSQEAVETMSGWLHEVLAEL